jgi:hypothetical protein
MARAAGLFKRTVRFLLVAELVYLVLVNGALQLSLTQDLVNMIRPHKFHVQWDRAWSFYPFRVHVRGASANGQSRSQQWQVDVDAASGSISLLPLVLKRVYIRGVHVENVDYRQRPRLKPDKDYSKLLAYFPEIEGREMGPAETAPRKKKRPWKVSMKGVSANGEFKLWIYNLQGSIQGSALADLKIESRGGPFSLDAHDLDLELMPAYLNGEAQVMRGGLLRGRVGFTPFRPRENKGLKMLPFLQLDTEVELEVGSLAFINLFTSNLGDFAINGAGQVRVRLHYVRGYMLAGTDLTAEAENLAVNVRQMEILGQGQVRISNPETEDKPLMLVIGYDQLSVKRDGDPSPFLEGDSLKLAYGGSNWVIPEPSLSLEQLRTDEAGRERRKNNTLQLDISDATLSDMSIINDYLPVEHSLRFTGGTAQLQAAVSAVPQHIEGGLQLLGTGVSMHADGQDLEGDLEVDLVIAGGIPREMRFDLKGSNLTLDKVRVAGQQQSFDDELWSARVVFNQAEAVIDEPLRISAETELRVSDTRPLVALFDNRGNPPKFVSRLLTMKDIEGEATIQLADNRLAISNARVTSDKAEVAAKAVFYETGRDGVIYARYKKLDATVKMSGEKKKLELFGARDKFEEYVIPVAPESAENPQPE